MIVECQRCHLRHDVSGRPPGTRARCRCGHVFVLPDPPGEGGRIACPGCGGPSRPDDRACEFCGAALQKVRCPRCFAAQFAGAQHCSQCGARVDAPARAVEAAESARACPRCRRHGTETLVAQVLEGSLLDHCEGCGGLWIDQDAFERLTTRSERQTAALRGLGSLPLPRGKVAGDDAGVVYLKCPDCDELMHRQNYGKRSGIVIDVCRAHGIWFDHDELARVLSWVRDGGLDDARRRDIEDMREEARRLRAGQRVLPEGGGYFDSIRLAEGGDAVFDLVDVLASIDF